MIRRYNAYNDEVLKTLPKERLLLYDVKSGWEPLCSFWIASALSTIPEIKYARGVYEAGSSFYRVKNWYGGIYLHLNYFSLSTWCLLSPFRKFILYEKDSSLSSLLSLRFTACFLHAQNFPGRQRI